MPETMQIAILGPGVAGRSRAVNAQQRQNLFLEIKEEKDKSNLVAYGTPGLEYYNNLGHYPARGIWWYQSQNLLYAVSYDKLYEVRANGTTVERGTLLTTDGSVSMADNGIQLMLVDGENGYIFQPETADLSYTKPLTTPTRTYSQSGTTVTVTEPESYIALARSVGDSVTFSLVTGATPSGTYTITSVSETTWTFTAAASATTSGTCTLNNNGVVFVSEPLTNRNTGEEVEIQVTLGELNDDVYTVTVPETNAPNLVVGNEYVIKTVGTSNFTLVGASLNEVGTVFTATGTTPGTGTVSDANSWIFKTNTPAGVASGTLKVVNNFRNITTAYTGVSFPGANTVCFIDSYFVINNPGTKQFWLSGQYDGFYWDPLMYASKEAYTDNLVAVAVDNGCIVLIGVISQEYWQNTGNYPFPFQRIAGSPTDIGTVSRFSIARCNGKMTYLARTRRGGLSVVAIQNYQPEILSTPDLDYLFSQYENPSDAVAFSYRQNGHEFYQISFQFENVTWLYDATTNAWSILQSGTETRHYANRGTQYYDQMIVTDYRNGNLYVLDPQTYTDNGELIARELITPHFFASSSFNKLHIYRLRLDMQQGVGLATGQGQNPQAMLQVSRDGGFTYGNEMWTSFGMQGEYLKRAEWRRLGVSRSYVFKLRITDPVKVVLISAAAYATEASK